MEDFLLKNDGLLILSYNNMRDGLISKQDLRDTLKRARDNKVSIDVLYDMLDDLF